MSVYQVNETNAYDFQLIHLLIASSQDSCARYYHET